MGAYELVLLYCCSTSWVGRLWCVCVVCVGEWVRGYVRFTNFGVLRSGPVVLSPLTR